MFRAMKVLKFVLLAVVFCVIAGFVVKGLWNWLMPPIFGLRMITYWQALGLLVLSKLLLGGLHRHGSGGYAGRRKWKQRMEARWAKMSPEERERFRAGMRGKHCGWDPRGFGGEEAAPFEAGK